LSTSFVLSAVASGRNIDTSARMASLTRSYVNALSVPGQVSGQQLAVSLAHQQPA
jgi:hypothetical protein